jgi:hypothetical protein
MWTRIDLLAWEAFTIMKIAGRSSVTISPRYEHPSPASLNAPSRS